MRQVEEPPLTHFWGSYACPAACGRVYSREELLTLGHKVSEKVSEVTCENCRATDAWLAQSMENSFTTTTSSPTPDDLASAARRLAAQGVR